jgi:hypothetical protein
MMAAKTSQTTEKKYETEKDRIFDEAIDVLAKCSPFTASDAKGDKQIAFLVRLFDPTSKKTTMDSSTDPATSTSMIIRDEWGCQECRKRVHKLFNLVDANGDGILEPDADDVTLTEEQKAMVAEVKKFIHERNRDRAKGPEETWQLHVVATVDEWQKTSNSLDKKFTKEGVHHYRNEINTFINLQTKNKGGFDHYYMNPSAVSSEGIDLLLMNKAFHRYQRLMSTLFDKFMTQEDWDGMIESLEIMLKILSGATYGHKFVSSTTWFLNCFKRSEKPFYRMSLIERANFIGNAICSAPIGHEIGNQAAIPFYHQVNDNILGLLESAKGEEAMRKMVEMRLDPNFYQQKTAAPKAGAVAMAAKELGQFSMSIATVKEIETDPRFSATIKVGKSTNSQSSETTTDIYAGLRTKGNNNSTRNPTGAAGFASRVGNNPNRLPAFVGRDNRGKPTMTVEELMRNVNNGNIYDIEVYYTSEFHEAVLTSTTLKEEKLIHPHTWLFLNNQAKRFQTYKYLKVTHIVPIVTQTHSNCIFVMEGARDAINRLPIHSNLCLGEFLNSKYHACKSTFMEVGRMMGTKTPPASEGELAFGFGVSKAKQNGSYLNEDIEIFINGIYTPIMMSKWN